MAMNALLPTSLWTLPSNNTSTSNTRITPTLFRCRHHFRIQVNSSDVDAPSPSNEETPNPTILPPPISEKDLKKAVLKTAATFAPRASTATKNPAVPGSTLYTVFEVQGYATMLLGGALSFNLIFPSNDPDLWRLMGMWSIWMFTIPSLRARDCSKKEKEALNYLFILVPLLNVAIPFFVKSFAVVWSADRSFLRHMEWLKKLK